MLCREIDGGVTAAEQSVEHRLEVAEVLGEEVRSTGGVSLSRSRASRRQHVAVFGEGVDDELERGRDVHPAMQHHHGARDGAGSRSRPVRR